MRAVGDQMIGRLRPGIPRVLLIEEFVNIERLTLTRVE